MSEPVIFNRLHLDRVAQGAVPDATVVQLDVYPGCGAQLTRAVHGAIEGVGPSARVLDFAGRPPATMCELLKAAVSPAARRAGCSSGCLSV